jgi:hypothetical protein
LRSYWPSSWRCSMSMALPGSMVFSCVRAVLCLLHDTCS